jgi:hypothetical protein
MTLPANLRIASRLVPVVGLCSLLLALTAPPANSASSNDFSVAPATSGNATAPRAFFNIEAPDGAVINDRVTIANFSDAPLKADLYPADAFNVAADGSFALRTLKDPRRDVASWVKLPTGYLVVPPHTQSTVPFEIDIPSGASPGDHAGGIVALNTDLSIQNQGAVRVGVHKAVGARIYVRVKGPLLPSMAVTQLQIDGSAWTAWPLRSAAGAKIRYTIVNSGNVRLSLGATLTARDVFGRTAGRFKPRTLPELLPGQTVTVVEEWAHPPSLSLRLTPTLQLHVASLAVRRSGTSLYVIPWVMLVAIAVLVGLLFRRWRHGKPARLPESPTTPSQPVKVFA